MQIAGSRLYLSNAAITPSPSQDQAACRSPCPAPQALGLDRQQHTVPDGAAPVPAEELELAAVNGLISTKMRFWWYPAVDRRETVNTATTGAGETPDKRL